MHGIEWAAGFYEGEGCFSVHRNSYGHPIALRLSVAQRTLEPLEWFLTAVNDVGKLQHRFLKGKDFWNYVAGKTENAFYVAELLWPYLSERRKAQIEVAVDEFLSVSHIYTYDVTFILKEVTPERTVALVNEIARRDARRG
jgi:hypothetical protein